MNWWAEELERQKMQFLLENAAKIEIYKAEMELHSLLLKIRPQFQAHSPTAPTRAEQNK